MENQIVEIYTESTPNPESLKFVTNKHLLPNYQVEFKTAEQAAESLLAQTIFKIPFVQQVFISNHFVTITKKAEYEWYEITNELKQCIKSFLQSGEKPVSDQLSSKGSLQQSSAEMPESAEEKIKLLLDKYVKPAVENDGGYIAFKSFEKGIVKLSMQGSCSGCPSSQITLKAGIEGLLKRMVPEVNEVVAVEE